MFCAVSAYVGFEEFEEQVSYEEFEEQVIDDSKQL
jgi:hypothetical protein